MATSSIFANFDISDPKKARAFVKALEKSAQTCQEKNPRKKTLVTNPRQVKKLFQSLSSEN